jgi:hypothetical protein
MSELDARALQDIGASYQPDTVGAMGKAMTLKDMSVNQQMNELKLGQMQKSQQDTQQINNLLKGSNLTTSQGVSEAAEKLTKSGYAQQGMDLMKTANQYRSGEIDNQLKKMEMDDKLQDTLVTTLESVVQPLTELEGKLSPAEMDAKVKAVMPEVLLKFKQDHADNPQLQKIADQFMQNPNSMTWAGLKAAESSTKAGQAAHKTRIEEMRARTQEKNVDSEIKNRERNTDIRQTTANTKAGEGQLSEKAKDIMSEMTVQGITLPQGMRSKKVLYDTVNNLAEKYPDKEPDEIAKMIRTGQIDMTGSKTEATVLARREAGILPVEKSIVKQGGFLDQAEKAVSDVDFSKLKAAGKFENWSKEQSSDPKLASYKARIAELRAEYALVLSKGGQVTDAARHESEKVIPDIITKGQFKEIRGVITQGIEAAKSGTHEALEENAGRKTTQSGPSKISSDEDYNKLPSGAEFIAPDGSHRRKP